MIPVRDFRQHLGSRRMASAWLFAAALAVALLPRPSAAAMFITIAPVGNDVVASTLGGTLNTSGLSFSGNEPASGPTLWPVFAEIVLGAPAGFDRYVAITGPSSWGPPTSPSNAASSLGPLVGVSSGQFLVVPTGYVSGAPLGPASATFANATIASLELTPGAYVYSWGSGGNADSLTVTIVPEPATGALLTLGVVVLAARRRTQLGNA
ncbi:MAG: PEP-CTERM sorting domain-containing protein [Myxococcota bacterium]